MRLGKSEVKHPVMDVRTLRWAGEYADYIQRPQKRRGTRCTNRIKSKRKNN
jgi:hypothetical protein